MQMQTTHETFADNIIEEVEALDQLYYTAYCPRDFMYSSNDGASAMDLRGSSCFMGSGSRVSNIPPAPLQKEFCVRIYIFRYVYILGRFSTMSRRCRSSGCSPRWSSRGRSRSAVRRSSPSWSSRSWCRGTVRRSSRSRWCGSWSSASLARSEVFFKRWSFTDGFTRIFVLHWSRIPSIMHSPGSSVDN